MPTPEQRDGLRQTVVRYRATKPMLFIDFWNDGPMISGCLAGGRKYFHVNANGDIEPCVFCHFAVDNIRRTTIHEALASPFFQNIRAKQGEHDNLLRPCMLIDQPAAGRELFASEGAYPTHEGADEIFTGLADRMDDYSRSYADCRYGPGRRVQGVPGNDEENRNESMNVLLVNPHSSSVFNTFGLSLPPIGLLYVAASLEHDTPKAVVRDLAADGERLDDGDIRRADLVGISADTTRAGKALSIARSVATIGRPVVMGCPHPQFMAADIFAGGYVDYIVKGEGELVFPSF